MYSIYATETFKRLYESLDSSEKNWIDKIKEGLKALQENLWDMVGLKKRNIKINGFTF